MKKSLQNIAMNNTTGIEEQKETDHLPYWSHVLALIVYILLFLLAVFGNSLALWILRTKPELRTLTHAFLINLVISDLLLALLTPFEAVATFSATYVFGDYGCKMQRTSLYFFYAASILTLSAISLERYVAICYPMKYDYFKKCKSRIVLFIWLFSALIVIPHVYLSEERTIDGEIVCFQFHTTDETRAPFFWGYFVPCFFLLYILPLGMVTVTYWKAHKKLRELESRLEVNSTVDIAKTSRMRKEILRMLFVVIVFFVVQWTPFEIVEIRDSSPGTMDEKSPINSYRVAVHMLAFSNAVVNPILFGFMSKPFREGFKEVGLAITMLICCRCWNKKFLNKFALGKRGVKNNNESFTSSLPTISYVERDCNSSSLNTERRLSVVPSGFNDVQDSGVPRDHIL